MTTPAAPFWTPKRPCAAMVGLTVAVGLVGPVFTVLGAPTVHGGAAPLVPIACGGALVALQLRHSFAVCRGERPRGAWLTMPAMLALCYVPLIWYTWNWASTQFLVGASLGMVLPGRRLRITAMLAPAAGTEVYNLLTYLVLARPDGIAVGIEQVLFWGAGFMGSVVVYGAARMVRVAAELQDARTELAELAIARERLRVSRDLHDLVGQSLSAVSLRGDLALRLLEENPDAAHAEIATLTTTARSALHDVLTVTRDGHRVDLRSELAGARELLTAAGIFCTMSLDCVDDPVLSAGRRTVLAWALREGVTNVLRHSDATVCTIIGSCGDDGLVRLEMVNDGIRPGGGAGCGLTGLAERARSFGGEVTAGPAGDGRFRLLVELRGET